MPYIREIQGEYTTVVGFPAARFYQELLKKGIDLLKPEEEEKMSYQACIFDLDGTLCDSVESIAVCANRALKDFGMKEATIADFKVFVGDGVDVLIRRLLKFGGDEKGAHFEKVKARYMEYFKEGCLLNVKPYPGIVEALQELKKQGARLGVLSNKPHENTVEVIREVFGEGVFDLVQGQSDAFPRKPDPAGALYLAKQFGVKPEACMYMGDTGTDMETGTAAGMYTVGVLWGFRDEKELREHRADCVISDAADLVRIYEKGGKAE